MKKTFISATIGLALAASACAVDNSGSYSTPTTGNSTLKGFTMDFSAITSFTINGSQLDREAMEEKHYTTLQLESLTLTKSGGGGFSDIKLAVYELGENNSLSDYLGVTGVGLHDGKETSAGLAKNSVVTYTFETPVNLSTSGHYVFMFVQSDKDATASNLETYGKTVKTAAAVGDSMLIPSSGDAWTKGTVATTYTFKAVPEPATATLSLLALAGLAARRRRK